MRLNIGVQIGFTVFGMHRDVKEMRGQECRRRAFTDWILVSLLLVTHLHEESLHLPTGDDERGHERPTVERAVFLPLVKRF